MLESIQNDISFVTSFVEWRNSLHQEIRGGKIMFDVIGNYKWLTESELFNFYIEKQNESIRKY